MTIAPSGTRRASLRKFALSVLAACAALASVSMRAAGDEIYSQTLIRQILAKNPGITLLSVHAVSWEKTSRPVSHVIASSNPAEIGKPSSLDDLAALLRPAGTQEPRSGAIHLALPLKDEPGNVIALLAADVTPEFAKDGDAALARLITIRDDLATRIGSQRHLYALYAPVVPAPYAQALVERTRARHPELVHLSIQAIPPGESGYRIIATEESFRLGRKDDPDDLIPLTRPDVHAIPNNRMTVCGLALHDSTGGIIGMIVMQVPYSFVQEPAGVLAFGQKIQDELKGQIRSLDQLFSPAGL